MRRFSLFLFFVLFFGSGCSPAIQKKTESPKKVEDAKKVEAPKGVEACYLELCEVVKKSSSDYYRDLYLKRYAEGVRNPSMAYEIALYNKNEKLAECFLDNTDDKEHLGRMFGSTVKYYAKKKYKLLDKFKKKDFDRNKKVAVWGTGLFGKNETNPKYLRNTPPSFLFDGDLFSIENWNEITNLFYEIYKDNKIDPNCKNERMETPLLFLLINKESFNSAIDARINYLIEKGGEPKELYYEEKYPEHSFDVTKFLVAFNEYIPIDKPRKDLYRFIYYSFHGRLSLYSIFINEKDEKIIEAKKLDWDTGKIAKTVTKKISDKEWGGFIEKTKSVNYWEMQTVSDFKASFLGGENWYFEGFVDGKHHLVYRHTPLEKEYYIEDEYYSKQPVELINDITDFRSLCMHLVELSGMKLR